MSTTEITTTTANSDDLIFKLLTKLKATLQAVFSFDDSSLSSMIVSGALMPLVQQMMADPMIRDAIISDVITDDIKTSIEGYDSFKLVRQVKTGVGMTIANNLGSAPVYNNDRFNRN